jgi:hypothetical protein
MKKGNYWDIDDILAEEEPIQVTITKPLRNNDVFDT